MVKHDFHCPDCGRRHDEPAEAAFVLAVRCADCHLADALAAAAAWRRPAAA